MDSQSRTLVDIISNAIKSAFSEFAQQQNYERTYYQQPITSANAVFSYGSIQQQRYEQSAYIYPRSSSTTTTSVSTVPGSACDDCLMPLHQHNSYQSMETSQTAPVPSSLLPLSQVDFRLFDTCHNCWHMRICSTFLDIHLETLHKFKSRQAVKVVSWNHSLFPKVHSRDGSKNQLLIR
jgi:hypothetical protein